MRFRTWGRGPSGATGGLLCFFVLGNRAFAALTHLLSRFQKFLSKVEETFQCICCQELVFRPITTVCQHNVCKVRGRPREPPGGPKGCSDPCRHPVMAGFTRTSCPLPFRGLRVCFPGCLAYSCSPLPHQPSSQLPIAPPPPCASSHTGPLLGPLQAGLCLPSLGVTRWSSPASSSLWGSRVGEEGLLSCSCRLVILNDLSGPQAGLERHEALIT